MASKQVIVVLGATGNQGGSVIDSILNDPHAASRFQLRAVTRNVESEKAKTLASKGVEVVSADLDDKAALHKAIRNAYGVFAVTNFWDKMDATIEEQQGKNIADVSKAEGVQHLVWSSLLNVKELSKGVLPDVRHFDAKARVEEYIRSLSIPASFFLPGFYISNMNNIIRKDGDAYTLALPIPSDSPMPIFDASADTGKFVKAIFLHREDVLGKRIYGATKYATPAELAKEFTEVFGKTVNFFQLDHTTYKAILGSIGMPPPGQEEMLQNMRLMPEFGYYGGASLDFSHSILDEVPTTWKEYISASPAFQEIAK